MDLKNPGWMYVKAALFLVIGAACFALVLVGNPSLMTVVYLGGMLGVAGLDARFRWTMGALPPALVIAAVCLYLLGDALVAWAMATNKFFSSTVRIQEGKGHAVVTDGPYRYVRHPGYVAAIPNMASTALILGSTWALVGAGVVIVLLIVRTAFEDRMLHEELAGSVPSANAQRSGIEARVPGAGVSMPSGVLALLLAGAFTTRSACPVPGRSLHHTL